MGEEIEYAVGQGECIDSIAFEHGFFVDTIWDYSKNSELKKLRKDPNILQPGDIVIIPELKIREESCAAEKKHRFRRKGVPAKLSLVFYRPKPPEEEEGGAGGGSGGGGSGGGGGGGAGGGFGSALSSLTGGSKGGDDESVYKDPAAKEQKEPEMEPIANAPYIIDIDGKTSDGTSDGDGKVELPIPPNARQGTIKFHPGADKEISFPLNLGHMDSIETVVGARKRLYNMAYRCSPEGEELDPDLKDALMRFQKENDLKTTGEIDQATKDKLVQVHGS